MLCDPFGLDRDRVDARLDERSGLIDRPVDVQGAGLLEIPGRGDAAAGSELNADLGAEQRREIQQSAVGRVAELRRDDDRAQPKDGGNDIDERDYVLDGRGPEHRHGEPLGGGNLANKGVE